MKKIFSKKHVSSFLILLIILLGVFASFLTKESPSPTFEDPPKKKVQVEGNFISLTAGDTNVQLEFLPGKTLLDALKMEKNRELITFSGKNYTGLGFFITEIGPLHANNGKNLFYYVNGKEAQVGISSYKPKDKDIIIWKLK